MPGTSRSRSRPRSGEIAQLRQQLADIQREKELSAQDIKNLDLQITSGLEEIARVRQHLAEAARDIDKRDADLQTVLKQCTDITDMVSSTSERFTVRFGTLEVAHRRSGPAEPGDSAQPHLADSLRRWIHAPRRRFAVHRPFATPAPNPTASPPSLPSKPAEKQSPDDFFELVCDEPQAGIETPRTGKIVVRGWALAAAESSSSRFSLARLALLPKPV